MLIRGNKLFLKMVVILSISFIVFSCSSEDDLSDYNEETEKLYYISDYYDFSSERQLNKLGEFEFSTSKNDIIFNSKHGSIEAPLRYYNNLDNFNFNGIYRIENLAGEVFFFRFGWTEIDDGVTKFSDVNWINKIPENSNEATYQVSTVEIEFIQEGSIGINMIGASQNWWKSSQNLRKYMNHYFEDLIFVGSNTDVHGYPHEAEGGNGTEDVLRRFDYIPEADFYTVLLGVNDYRDNVEKTYSNFIELFERLEEKNPEAKIIYISPLPTPNSQVSDFNNSLESKIVDYINDKPEFLFFNFKERILMKDNWREEYYADDLHLNKDGVDLLAQELSKKLEFHINSTE